MKIEPTLLSLCIIHFLAVASPGPDFILVARNSLSSSVRAGLSTAAGITLGNGIHILYSVLAASYLSAQHANLFAFIKIAGGLYLGWIGWKCVQGLIKDWGTVITSSGGDGSPNQQNPSKTTLATAFSMGLTTTLLNAKAAIYFISIVTQFVRSDQLISTNILSVSILLSITGSWFSFVSWITGSNFFRERLLRHQLQMEGLMGVVLLGYAAAIVVPPLFSALKPVLW